VLAGCSKPKTEPAAQPETKAESRPITMEKAAQQHVGLQVAPVKITRLLEYLQVTGTVQPVNSRVGQVRSLARGRLIEVLARVGDRVRAGQELARIDNLEAAELAAQFSSARAELQRLKVVLTAQSRQVERNRKLAEIGASPKKDYEQSQSEYQALEESIRSQEGVVSGINARLRRFGITSPNPSVPVVTAIASPFSGVITKAATAPGDVIEPTTELFTVADISHVWVQAEVYEKDLGRIQVGQSALVHVDTYPSETFTGQVAYIADALDPQTRTAKVRCEVSNASQKLKLDMYATIQLPTTFNRLALAVPVGAIQQLEGKTVVFVRRGPTEFEAREIRPGKTVNDQVEVLGGLREGEPIVTAGAFHLKSVVAGKELGE
jgi:cobalt-zinc-cadmium efflux system membrane fusion protein